MKRPLIAALGLWALAVGGVARGEPCSEQYFAPDDSAGEHPAKRPHRQFLNLQRAARAGDAAAQRGLAVAYDTGYLVSSCPEKAASWYRRAAAAGDADAKAWMRAFADLRDGPECAGGQCGGVSGEGVRAATFFAGPNGHYFAPVTINGITVRGMVDTGASTLAMSEETARRFGIAYEKGAAGMAMTANGQRENRVLVLPQVTVGGISLANVRVAVGITGDILIGMSFLSRLNVRMEGGQLTLSR